MSERVLEILVYILVHFLDSSQKFNYCFHYIVPISQSQLYNI